MLTGYDVEFYGHQTLPPELFALDLPRERHQARGGPLTETQILQLLASVPGSRRAARGVIIDGEDGAFTQVFGLTPLSDPDLTMEELNYFSVCTKAEILRLRTLRSGHDQLLRLRANAIVNSPRLMRVFAERRRLWEVKKRPWTLTAYYSTLNRPAQRYVDRLSRAHQRVVRPLPLGYVPIVEANAVCMKTLVGDVILVSEMLRHFYYFAVICLIGGNYGIGHHQCIEAGLIAARIIVGSEAADFDIDPRAQPAPEIERLIRNDVDAMIEFTYGHELAHHLLGHLEEEVAGSDMRTYSHRQEYEADLAAILNVRGEDARRKMADAAYKVLLALEMIKQLSEVRPEIPSFSMSATHPAPVERLWALHAALGPADAPRRSALVKDLNTVEARTQAILSRLDEHGPNVLSFYGSLYIYGLIDRMPRDRLEF